MSPAEVRPEQPPSPMRGLHLATLSAFAIAQPVYALLGPHPTFFVAHGAGPKEILHLILLLSALLPVCLAAVGFFFLGLAGRTGRILHCGLVFLLVLLALYPGTRAITEVSDLPGILLAALLGAGFTLGYARLPAFRTGLTFASPTIALFPLFFLFVSPVQKLVFVQAESARAHAAVERPIPIVLVVFDELSPNYLLNEEGKIDDVRYPNFAALAETSHWFRRATTVSDGTNKAVPAILSGSYYHQDGETRKIPARVDYPHNLFTLLDGIYGFNVVESLTALAPPQSDPAPHRRSAGRYDALFLDAAIAYLHVIAPPSLSNGLPNVSQDWGGFLARPVEAPTSASASTNDGGPRPKKREWFDSREQFSDFVSATRTTRQPSLNFLHTIFPHVPFEYLPSGKRYGRHDIAGLRSEVWENDDAKVRLGFQRHLLQLGYTDKLLGELIADLQASGLYEAALFIVTADHGVSFRAGRSRRGINEINYGEIAPVPLFIKLPGQQTGLVSDRRAEVTDILPTIADVIGATLPWPVDGSSLFDTEFPDRSEIVVNAWAEVEVVFQHSELDSERKKSRDRMLSIFGSGATRPNGLFEIGPKPELVGKAIGSDLFAKASRFRSKLEQPAFLDEVDLGAQFIPAYVRGRVMGDADADPPREVAIAVNGQVFATARTSSGGWFGVMLPEKAFRDGHNEVDLFAIEQDQTGQTGLFRTEGMLSGYALDGQNMIELATGESNPLVPKQVGYWRRLPANEEDRTVALAGWAADVEAGQLVDSLLIFIDGRLVHEGPTEIDRPDVSKSLQNEALRKSGFEIVLPRQTLNNARETRVIASSEGVFSEVHFVKATIGTLQDTQAEADPAEGG